MDEQKSIIHFHTAEYGSVKLKLSQVLERRGMTRNHLRTLTGTKYDIIDRYYKAENVARVDLDFLAKVCYVLDCRIEDLLEYQPPKEEQSAQVKK